MALSKIPTDLVSGSLASSQLPAQLSISSSASSGSLAVDSSGNVGVGTSSPVTKLQVNGITTTTELNTANGGIRLQSNFVTKSALNVASATNQGVTGTAVGDFYQWTTGGKILWSTNNGTTANLVLDSSGNLLVGTTSTLDINGGKIQAKQTIAGVWGAWIEGVDRGLVVKQTATSSFAAYFLYNTTPIGSISTNTTSVAYNTTSDYRLKEDWVAVADASTRVNALKPVNFAWKVNGTRVDGFLAHEVQEVVPEAVTGEKDAVDAEGNPEYQGIDQSKLVPLLTAALQEALGKIETLEARVAALEGGV